MKIAARAYFLGDSIRIAEIRKRASLLADFPFPILITGETGCGKYELALLIHEKSRRAGDPFVEVHCANLTDTLFESELFGHERGAFTDAKERRAGRVEAAGRGTLLFDEIDCLPLSMQPKLLRFFDRQNYERVGGRQTFQSDAGLICATNQDLKCMAAAGRFRADLLERLTWAVIHIPPLRERRQDITLLAGMFLEEARSRFGIRQLHWDTDALRLLEVYEWPGNVRELKSVTYTAAYLHDGSVVRASDIASVLRDRNADEHERPRPEGLSLARHDWERELIADALRRTDGNRVHAARLLKIGRRTLQSKIAKYGL